MLGLTPAIGRLLGPQDDALGSERAAVAVLSWASWTNRFHADPSVVGKRLVVDGVQATVIGVAPRHFFGLQIGAAPEIWLPVAMEPLIQTPSRRASGELTMSVMARLKPGVPRDQARAELRVIDRDRIEEIAKRGDLKWLKVTIDVVPATAGMSSLTFVLREAAVRADGDRFRAAAAGVHQRGGPPAGAWRRSFPRDGRASVARRRLAPPGAAGADRVAAARRGRLSGRHRARLLRC